MKAARVLIVDDNEVNTLVAQAALDADGLATESAADASEARRKVVFFRPHLILMDIQMPGMDGLALARLFKDDPATWHVLIVAFTALDLRSDVERLCAAGCDGYLSKPIDVTSFATQVRACIAARAVGPVDTIAGSHLGVIASPQPPAHWQTT